MQSPVNEYPPEHKESLWLLTAAPIIWAVHFLLCYLTAAIWCAKLAPADGALAGVRIALAVYTVLALAGIGLVAWIGLHRYRFGHTTGPPDFDLDIPGDRHRFLGFATLLLSGLSAVAVLYVSLAAVFIETCY